MGRGRGSAAPIPMEGGRQYTIKVEYTQNGRGGAELNWIPPASVLPAEAGKIAGDSDVVLLFAGLNGTQEGEGHDRSAIELPETQENLVRALIALGKPVVVILTSGSAVAVNSAAEGAAAVLSAWYVVQLYIAGETGEGAPIRSLRGFQRIHLKAGERKQVTFTLSSDALPKSAVEVSVGGGQPIGNTPYVKGSL